MTNIPVNRADNFANIHYCIHCCKYVILKVSNIVSPKRYTSATKVFFLLKQLCFPIFFLISTDLKYCIETYLFNSRVCPDLIYSVLCTHISTCTRGRCQKTVGNGGVCGFYSLSTDTSQ